MVSPTKLSQLRGKLLGRRDQIPKTHAELEQNRQELREPEVEFEEWAQKEAISEPLEKIDTREKEELDAIDRALNKVVAGTYGLCESCGKKIPLKRLEAVPWAARCGPCEKKRKEGKTQRAAAVEKPEKAAGFPGLPPDYQGLTDGEIVETIFEELESDGRVEMEELRITSSKGTLHLGGFLPSEKKRRVLLQILQDEMGFSRLEDQIQIDPLLWQRQNRTPGKKAPSFEDIPVQEEKRDAYTSRTEGVPFIPPDALVPEEEE